MALILQAATAGLLYPVKTESIEILSYQDFIRGEFSNLSLSNRGDLSPGPHLSKITDIEASVIWTAIADPEGNIYLGTANRGEVLKVGSDGEVSSVFKPDAALTRALALDAEGNLYAGVSPSGRVYRIRPGERPEIYFDPPAAYIWDLRFDPTGALFVATGAPGEVYRLPPDFRDPEQAEKWFTAAATHISSLILHPDSGVLAGTSPQALLYHLIAPDEAVALFHAGGDEITHISLEPETGLYFSTLNRKGVPQAFADSTPLDLPALLDKMQSGDNRSAAENNKQEELPSFLYRLDEDGFAEPVWTPGGSNLFALADFPGETGFLAGTDTKGKLFHVVNALEWKLLAQSPNGGEISYILNATTGENEIITYVFTSNPAAVFRLTHSAAEDAVYTSRVIDARNTARWGNLQAIGDGGTPPLGISWLTRGGNTPEPDETWSEWQQLTGTRAASPAARYLQFKAAIAPDADILRGLRLFYQYRNAAPIVTNINILPIAIELFSVAGPKGQPVNLTQLTSAQNIQQIQQPPPVRQQFRVTGDVGYISTGWHAVDPNGDTLVFTLSLRPLGGQDWLTLAENLDVNAHSFNTRGFADGYYELKVMASDAPSNAPGSARTGYLVSRPFLINNTPPQIKLTSTESAPGKKIMMFEGSTAFGIISHASYALNGAAPQILMPDDQMFDSNQERFTLTLNELTAGTHSLIVEIMDENGNRAAYKRLIRID